MSGFIFVPIVRVPNVGFLAIVRNVICTNCRGAETNNRDGDESHTTGIQSTIAWLQREIEGKVYNSTGYVNERNKKRMTQVMKTKQNFSTKVHR